MAASVDSSGGRKLRSRQWVGSTQAADRNRQNAGWQQEGSKQSASSIGHAVGMQQVGNRQTIRQQAGSRKEGGRQQEGRSQAAGRQQAEIKKVAGRQLDKRLLSQVVLKIIDNVSLWCF